MVESCDSKVTRFEVRRVDLQMKGTVLRTEYSSPIIEGTNLYLNFTGTKILTLISQGPHTFINTRYTFELSFVDTIYSEY